MPENPFPDGASYSGNMQGNLWLSLVSQFIQLKPTKALNCENKHPIYIGTFSQTIMMTEPFPW